MRSRQALEKAIFMSCEDEAGSSATGQESSTDDSIGSFVASSDATSVVLEEEHATRCLGAGAMVERWWEMERRRLGIVRRQDRIGKEASEMGVQMRWDDEADSRYGRWVPPGLESVMGAGFDKIGNWQVKSEALVGESSGERGEDVEDGGTPRREGGQSPEDAQDIGTERGGSEATAQTTKSCDY